MPVFLETDSRDNLTTDQLQSMANSDHSWLIDYIEHKTIFDAHRIRLLLEFGVDKSREILNTPDSEST